MMIDEIRPMAPAIIRITPTVASDTPATLAVTANFRIAPSAKEYGSSMLMGFSFEEDFEC